VSALVLTATAAAVPASTRLLAGAVQALNADPGARAVLARVLASAAFSTRALDALPSDHLEAMVAGLAQALPAGTGPQFGIATQAGVQADLARVAVPTLVVVTTQDRVMPPEAQRALAAGIAGAERVEIACGHLIAVEAGDPWREAVTRFLAGVDAQADR